MKDEKRWELCGIPKCNPSCLDGSQWDYQGTKSTTESGKECQRWDAQTPHEHRYTPEDYPQSGLKENYCRNPSPNYPDGAWCYTMKAEKRWEFCGIPQCTAPKVCPTVDETRITWREDRLCYREGSKKDKKSLNDYGEPAECDLNSKYPCCANGRGGGKSKCQTDDENKCLCPTCFDYRMKLKARAGVKTWRNDFKCTGRSYRDKENYLESGEDATCDPNGERTCCYKTTCVFRSSCGCDRCIDYGKYKCT